MSSYYRGAHAIIFVYDVTNRESFEHIESRWIQQVELYSTRSNKNCVMLILANKIDLIPENSNFIHGEGPVSTKEGQELSARKNILFGEISNKSDKGITQAIKILSEKLITTFQSESSEPKSNSIKLTSNQSEIEEDFCSC